MFERTRDRVPQSRNMHGQMLDRRAVLLRCLAPVKADWLSTKGRRGESGEGQRLRYENARSTENAESASRVLFASASDARHRDD